MKLSRDIVKILVDAYNDYPDMKFLNGNMAVAVSYSSNFVSCEQQCTLI